MFSIATVASSTRMPTASARPPRVMMLIVSPSALSTIIEARIDSGIEIAMISVLRQLPRKSRIISAGQAGGDHRLAHHAVDRGAHEDRLIGQRLDLQLRRQGRGDARQRVAHAADDVERRGVARLQDRQRARRAGRPAGRCSSAAPKPSRTCATSRM